MRWSTARSFLQVLLELRALPAAFIMVVSLICYESAIAGDYCGDGLLLCEAFITALPLRTYLPGPFGWSACIQLWFFLQNLKDQACLTTCQQPLHEPAFPTPEIFTSLPVASSLVLLTLDRGVGPAFSSAVRPGAF